MKRISGPRLCPRKISLELSGEMKFSEHKPVLLREAIADLITKKNGIYVDATFGRGGHSKKILGCLDEDAKLICIDKDEAAIKVASDIKDARVIVRQGSFAKIKSWTDELNYSGKISGILLDLGVSSPQLDDAARGFSFLRDGPLDMRMAQSDSLTAADWINRAKESEIAFVLKEYGEERFSKRIANAIVAARMLAPITTTGQLAAIVSRANPRWEEHKHPATRAFQAIRIFINNELQELSACLEQCLDILEVGGRLVVISFHSLEDRIVKRFMKIHASGDVPEGLPIKDAQIPRRLKILGHVVRASAEEMADNPRARSAVLRKMEKLK